MLKAHEEAVLQDDGSAGTPRQPQGPGATAAFRFGNEKDAYEYVRGRGRSPDQVAMLVSAAQMGHAVANITTLMRAVPWVLGSRGPASKAQGGDLASETSFVNAAPPQMAAGLEPAIEFADLGRQMVEAAQNLVFIAKKVSAFFEENPGLEQNLSHWQRELQMIAAFTLHAAETEKLEPQLGPDEMEAVALLVGYRDPAEEFGRESDLQRDNWRKMLKKVEEHVLPVLRSLKTTTPSPEQNQP